MTNGPTTISANLPINEKQITKSETTMALKNLKLNEAARNDDIPAELGKMLLFDADALDCAQGRAGQFGESVSGSIFGSLRTRASRGSHSFLNQ